MSPSVSLGSNLGVPVNPSYVPSFWSRHSDAMRFAERLYNALVAFAELLPWLWWSDSAAEQRALDHLYAYPGHQHCPPLSALRDAVSLTLVNSHYSVSYARPYPPNVVPVAGMHVSRQPVADVDPVRGFCI